MVLALPTPPENLSQWLTILTASCTLLVLLTPRLRKWVIQPLLNPLLNALERHEERHLTVEEAVQAQSADLASIKKELAYNGSDGLLPEHLREKPIRALAIWMVSALEEHMEFSDSAIEEINRDRRDRGLPPIDRK
jgi:hypothetical protein